MSVVYIGLGSNIGDRVGYVQQAHKLLSDTEGITIVNSSSLYETEPCGYKDQEWFVNAVLEIETTLEPYKLLEECQRIEKQLGRVRHPEAPQWGPRTVDLDILLYDDLVIADSNLQIPHSRLHQRAYALVPILELAPDLAHPVLGRSILDMHSDLEDPEEVYLYGTRRADV
ncbi:MAG: 2-amino-4-hydroxy-6-hydroxymethyldihydropteridine diphosphokinase [Candidatus Melainabacteria bacterium GWF2_32_7]|nr:MAG: 2-amino-4-hydroxy-6-hydroxymethyldihydropteridine diphosphokinase [Candidatus Melainabacteria bacterium GWF2_32_7]